MADTRQSSGSAAYFLTGFLVGGLTAAVTTLLVAPQSGKQTREQLLKTGIDLSNEAIENATSVYSEALQKGEKLTKDVKETASDLYKRGHDLLDEQRTHLAAAIAGEK